MSDGQNTTACLDISRRKLARIDDAWNHGVTPKEEDICFLIRMAEQRLANTLPGWKLVPIEATDAQLRAGADAWLADRYRRSSTLYRAMVDAAPTPVSPALLTLKNGGR